MTPGLGPPRPAQRELLLADWLTQTVARDLISRPLTQDGVAERFPDWTAVGFRFSIVRSLAGHALTDTRRYDLPDPFPRIACPLRPIPGPLWHAGSDAPLFGGLSPRGAAET